MQAIGSFPKMVARTKVEFTDEDLKFILKQNYRRTVANNGSLTINEKLLDLPELKTLNNSILKEIEKCCYEILLFEDEVKPIITDSWCVINKPGDWSPAHKHYNNNLSAVLYLKKPENSGEILFHRDDAVMTDNFSTQMVFKFKKRNHFNSHIGSMKTEAGDMIIFPSSLNHSVQLNETKEDRIAIALNIFLEGKFDAGTLASVHTKVIKE